MDIERGRHRVRGWRAVAFVVLVLVVTSVAWWAVGRLTLENRKVTVREWDGAVTAPADSLRTLRVLAWNIAHGRGDVGLGLFRNWWGGSPEVRIARMAHIADVVERVAPDLLILNEVDFDSHWSGGVNQAEVLARTLGYPYWVEQRNYDLRLPFATLSFGNAVLSRFPIESARWVDIPPHSGLEALVVGAKGASVVRFQTPAGPLAVVPVHLEVRSSDTRLSAVPVLDSLRLEEAVPIVLAGDFNSSPSEWPGGERETALGKLLDLGWRSPRAEGSPDPPEWTYPSYGLVRGIDWVLVAPPLQVLEARVVEGAQALSDHLPVISVVTFGREP